MKINRSILNIVIAAILFALIAPVMTYAQEDDEAGGAISIEARRGKGRRDSLRNKLKAATAKVQELQNRTNALLQQLQTQAGTAKEKEAALNQLTANLNELKTKLAEKENLFTELQAELKAAKAGASQKEKDDAMELGKALEREKTLMKTNEGLVDQIKKLTAKNKQLEEKAEKYDTRNQAKKLVFKNLTDTKPADVTDFSIDVYARGKSEVFNTGEVAAKATKAFDAPTMGIGPSIPSFFGREGSAFILSLKYKPTAGPRAGTDTEIHHHGVLDWNKPEVIIEDDEGKTKLYKLTFKYEGAEIVVELTEVV